jgi:hypothetical protein
MKRRTARVYSFVDAGGEPLAMFVVGTGKLHTIEPSPGCSDLDSMAQRARAWLAARRFHGECYQPRTVRDVVASNIDLRRGWVLAFLAAARLGKLERFLQSTCEA